MRVVESVRVPLLSIAFFAAGSVLAQPPEAEVAERDNGLAVWAGYGDSDNIGRTPTPESGTYRSVGLFLDLDRETARLDASISSDIEYRRYSIDSYDNETVGYFDGQALIDLIEDRFSWNFSERLDQGQLDAFAPIGPNNRETINVFTHGPRLDIPFGRTSLGMSAYRSQRRYDESAQIDNENDNFEISLARQASRTASYALVASTSETEFEGNIAPGYEIDRVVIRMNKLQSRGELNVDIGTNEISSATQSQRDPVLSVDWSRSLSGRSDIGIAALREFSDSGNYAGDAAGTLVTTAPFEQKRLDVSYDLTGARTSVSLGMGIGEEDYAGGTTFDNDFENAYLAITYRSTARLQFGFDYDLYDRTSPVMAGPGSSQEDRTAGVWLNRLLGRSFSVALDISRYEGSGAFSVDETRTELRFSYSPTGDTAAALQSIGR